MKRILRRRLHISWQIAAACGGIFSGVVVTSIVQVTWAASLAWLALGILLVVLATVRQRVIVVTLAVGGGLLIGLWRGSIEQAQLEWYSPLYEKTVTIHGIVSDDADIDKDGGTVIRLADVEYAEHHLPGKVWVSFTNRLPVQRSDSVVIRGTLGKGFGTFAGSMYRAEMRKIVRPEPGDVALYVRDWFASGVRKAVPEPESSLGVGYLVGQRRSLPDDLDTALKTAGLTHIVVASGYNLTILVRLARRLFEKVSKYLSALAGGGMIAGFVAVTGLSPSMSRAGLIAGLSLLAWYYGRKFHPVILLAIAVAVTVLFNPSYAWGDVGWQLSFAAFAGVMLLAPLLQAFYFGDKKPGTVRQILGETIAATLCTLPILLYSFGYMSNVAIFANMLILPLVPLAMLLTFIGGAGGLLVPGIAMAIGGPAYLLLSYMVQTTEFFAGLSWARSEVTVQIWQVVLMYVLLLSFGIFMWWRTRLDLRQANIVE